jgi:DNA-binding NarL/FixJ family response regulator
MNPVVRLAGSTEYLLHPLLSYILMAVGLGLCLYLFMTLKVEIRRLLPGRVEDQQRVEALESALAEARLTVQQLENDLREVERQTGMLVAPAPARSGLNLSKRTQVLRLHRSGESSAAIATSLGLPRGEVDLLIKVHGMVLEQI